MIAAAFITATSASAVRYKGFGELNGGTFIPSKYYSAGVLLGISTSHGVELFDGLFVGGGIDINYFTFTEPGESSYDFDESDYAGNFAIFAEGRYNFLRKVSPFIGLRIGGGYEGVEEQGYFYFSPAAGVTINLTKKFGLDASLGYSLWSGPSIHDDDYRYGHSSSFNGVSVRFGVHFWFFTIPNQYAVIQTTPA